MKSKASRHTLLDDYHAWLCDLVNTNQQDRSYWLLIKALHTKTFKWSVPNDDNRAFEGKNLREQFCDDMEIIYDLDDFPEDVSMLEVIIAISYRCESIMSDLDGGVTFIEWFWKILSNVGLDKFTDEEMSYTGPILIDEKLDMIIERTYNRNGKGGLFPLRHAKKDQRKIELWYQMSAYLIENYYTEGIV